MGRHCEHLATLFSFAQRSFCHIGMKARGSVSSPAGGALVGLGSGAGAVTATAASMGAGSATAAPASTSSLGGSFSEDG